MSASHNEKVPEEDGYECLICGAGGPVHTYFCSAECWHMFEETQVNKRLMFAELLWSIGGPDGSRHLIEKPDEPQTTSNVEPTQP